MVSRIPWQHPSFKGEVTQTCLGVGGTFLMSCTSPKTNGWIPKMMGLGKGGLLKKVATFGIYVRFLGCNLSHIPNHSAK